MLRNSASNIVKATYTRRLYSTYDSSSKVLSSLKNKDLIRTQGYINGQWVASSDNSTFEVNNPALASGAGTKIADVSSMTTKDYVRAINSAQDAFSDFKKTT